MAATLVIFDCDGVLVDSETLVGAVHVAEMARAGYAIEETELHARFLGMTDDAMLAEIARERGEALPDDYLDRVRDEFRRRSARDLRAMPGADDAAAAITCKRCVASSSATELLQFKLAATGLAPLFGESVFSADAVERGKPAPDVFLHAARSMGAAPQDCVVIEDSANGVRAGVAAGMRTFGFVGGAHLPAGYDAQLLAAGAETVLADFTWLRALVPSVFA